MQKMSCFFVDQKQIDGMELKKLYNEYYITNRHNKKFCDENWGKRFWLTQSGIINGLCHGGGRILDVGCNAGNFLYFLEGKWEKHGVEFSDYAAGIAKEKGLEIYNGYLEDAKYSSHFFDVVTLYSVIEHVKYPATLIGEVKRILKTGGLCVVMTGDRSSLKAILKREDWHMYCPPMHMYFFSHKCLNNFMRKNGFELIKSIYTDGGMTQTYPNLLNKIVRVVLAMMNKIPALHRLPIFDHNYSYYRKI